MTSDEAMEIRFSCVKMFMADFDDRTVFHNDSARLLLRLAWAAAADRVLGVKKRIWVVGSSITSRGIEAASGSITRLVLWAAPPAYGLGTAYGSGADYESATRPMQDLFAYAPPATCGLPLDLGLATVPHSLDELYAGALGKRLYSSNLPLAPHYSADTLCALAAWGEAAGRDASAVRRLMTLLDVPGMSWYTRPLALGPGAALCPNQ